MVATDLARPALGGVPVLVAEGDDDDSAALTTLLRLNGIDARDIRTPAAVLEAIARTRPAVLVLDLDLTRGELIRQARGFSSPPAVVVITAHTGADVRRASLQAGAAAYLLKPADPAEVVRVIQRLCAERSRE